MEIHLNFVSFLKLKNERKVNEETRTKNKKNEKRLNGT